MLFVSLINRHLCVKITLFAPLLGRGEARSIFKRRRIFSQSEPGMYMYPIMTLERKLINSAYIHQTTMETPQEPIASPDFYDIAGIPTSDQYGEIVKYELETGFANGMFGIIT